MLDIQTVSIAIASASVVAGVVYYSLQIRHQSLQIQQQNKMRQTDLARAAKIVGIAHIIWERSSLDAQDVLRSRENPSGLQMFVPSMHARIDMALTTVAPAKNSMRTTGEPL